MSRLCASGRRRHSQRRREEARKQHQLAERQDQKRQAIERPARSTATTRAEGRRFVAEGRHRHDEHGRTDAQPPMQVRAAGANQERLREQHE
jgi:hypothetical protein